MLCEAMALLAVWPIQALVLQMQLSDFLLQIKKKGVRVLALMAHSPSGPLARYTVAVLVSPRRATYWKSFEN